MMIPIKKLAGTLLVAAGLSVSAAAQNPSDSYNFPDPARKFIVVKAVATGEKMIAGQELPAGDSLAVLVMDDLSLPFNWQMIRMSQCARNLVHNVLSGQQQSQTC